MSRGGNPLALASTTPMLSDRITDAIFALAVIKVCLKGNAERQNSSLYT